MSDGHDGHKLEPLGEFQDLYDTVPVFKDFTDPDSAKVEGMHARSRFCKQAPTAWQSFVRSYEASLSRKTATSTADDLRVEEYLVRAARASLVSFSHIRAKRQGWLFNPEGAQDAAFTAAITKSRETGASSKWRVLRRS
jgi:hypothetical protein